MFWIDAITRLAETGSGHGQADADGVSALPETWMKAIGHTPDIGVWFGADGRVRWVSPSVERLLGDTPERWVGLHVGALFAEQSCYLQLVDALETTEQTVRGFAAEWVGDSGQRTWFDINAGAAPQDAVARLDVALPDEADDGPGYLMVGRDIGLIKMLTSMSDRVGSDYFQTITQRLSGVLHAEMVFIGELQQEKKQGSRLGKQVSVIARCQADNTAAVPDCFDLVDTPCMDMVDHGTCVFADGLTAHYPNANWIQNGAWQACGGTALVGPEGQVFGFLVALSSQPFSQPETVAPMLELFAERAAAELSRLGVQKRLEAGESQTLRHAQAIKDMVQADVAHKPGSTAGRQAMVELAGQAIGVAHASVWVMGDDGRCVRNATWQAAHPNNQAAKTKAEAEANNDAVAKQPTDQLDTTEAEASSNTTASPWWETNDNPDAPWTIAGLGQLDATTRETIEQELVLSSDEPSHQALAEGLVQASILPADCPRWLVSAVFACGKLNGVLVLASMHEPVAWTQEEKSFVRSVADLLAGNHTAGRLSETMASLRQSQARYRQLNQSLEARVAVRTAELEQTLENLRQTEQELVRSEKMASLGAMVATIAHEVNTPMGNALTVASSLEDRIKEFETLIDGTQITRSALKHFYDNLVQANSILLRSLTQASLLLRDFKQVAVNQTHDLCKPFDLLQLVDETVATLRPAIKQHACNVEIDVDIDPGLEIESQPGAVVQVLTNLVNNACIHAFADKQEGTIWITAEAVGETGDQIKMIVQDDGVGMDAETQKKAFDPFFTSKLGQGSTGLGLHIVYQLMTDTLGGSLDMTSRPGAGTRFALRLPRVLVEANPNPQKEAA